MTSTHITVINEGISILALDYFMAARVIKYLWQDYSKTDAFKLGIIDAKGTVLKKPETVDEKSAYSPFIRLILNLKRIIAKAPGGSTKIGSMVAAYAMMRECIDNEVEQNILDEIMSPIINRSKTLEESIIDFLKEDGVPVNSTAGATSSSSGGYDTPMNTGPRVKKLVSIINRKKPITFKRPI